MSKKSSRLINSSWLQASLILLAALVLLFLRSRRQQRLTSEQPMVWRRDIEMGPGEDEVAAAEAQAEPQAPARESVPEMRAGETLEAGENPEEATPGGDDLEIVEGIGPKISAILQAAGIKTFAQLAEAPVERLEEILRAAGLRRISNPASWPEQAALAAAAEWSKLEALQGKLKAGRRSG